MNMPQIVGMVGDWKENSHDFEATLLITNINKKNETLTPPKRRI